MLKNAALEVAAMGLVFGLAACNDNSTAPDALGNLDGALYSSSSIHNPGGVPDGNLPEGALPGGEGSTELPNGSGAELPGTNPDAPNSPDTPNSSDSGSTTLPGTNPDAPGSSDSPDAPNTPDFPASSDSGSGAELPNSDSSTEQPDAPTSNGNSPAITYSAAGAAVTNDNGCVTVNGGEVLISCAGDYDFSGSYSGADAQIRVYSPKSDSGVYLNLRGLTLENSSDAPVYIQMASKAFIVAKNETSNILSDGLARTKSYTYTNAKGETKTDTTSAAIYSKDDLTIKGAGSLTVKGNFNNGIQSSNDLRFRGETTVNVTALNNGIKGKGKVDIEKGSLTIEAKNGDGIKSDECSVSGTDTTIVDGKGIVIIKGGSVNITKAGDDGIQAFNYVMISDSVAEPSIKINSTGKGVVSENRVYVNAGKLDITSGDDGVHSNMNIDFNGGYTTITAKGNDGVHADSTLRVKDGTIHVKDSYEGLEAWYITITGGVTDVYASDDGWNAAGGKDASGNTTPGGNNNWGWGGPGGGFPGGMGGGSGFLTVTGGIHHIKNGSGDTDGIDSNGELTITGGVVVVECQISGGMGGSFDSDGTATLTSKTILGFSARQRSEAGTNYSISFNANSYYGNSDIAFKPTISGSYVQATSQPSAISNVSGYSKSYTFPSGGTVYYN